MQAGSPENVTLVANGLLALMSERAGSHGPRIKDGIVGCASDVVFKKQRLRIPPGHEKCAFQILANYSHLEETEAI